jgi:WD40 repeat protein
VSGVAVAADGRRVYTVGQDGTLRRWDVRDRQLIELDPVPTVRPATALAFVDQDRGLVVTRPGHPPQVWNLTGSPPPPTRPTAESGPVAISPDGKRVVGGGNGDTIRIWSLPGGGE